ncbi:MAG: RNA polymerase sigma factor [Nannocystales bacterium]
MAEPVNVHAIDLALAEAAARKEPEASRVLAARALRLVRPIVRSICSDRSEQDDALQLALMEVLRATGSYRGTGSLDGWIRRISTRAVMRDAKKNRTSRMRVESTDTPYSREGVSMNLTMLETLPRPLEFYLGALPEAQRVALVLRHAVGHSVVEVADMTAAPVPTVRSRIKKAQQELRRLIQRDLNLGLSATQGIKTS